VRKHAGSLLLHKICNEKYFLPSTTSLLTSSTRCADDIVVDRRRRSFLCFLLLALGPLLSTSNGVCGIGVDALEYLKIGCPGTRKEGFTREANTCECPHRHEPQHSFIEPIPTKQSLSPRLLLLPSLLSRTAQNNLSSRSFPPYYCDNFDTSKTSLCSSLPQRRPSSALSRSTSLLLTAELSRRTP